MIELNEQIITYKAGDKAGKPVENIKDFDRSDRKALMDFTKNEDIFNQQAINQFRPLLVDTIQNFGFDTARNRFLHFAASPKLYKAQFTVPYEAARLIQRELQERDQQAINSDWNKTSLWMFNPRSYQGDIFKIKALLLLSNPDEAEKYGDLKTRPIEQIVNASSRSEVEKILNNWTVSDGSEPQSRVHRYRSNAKRFDKSVPDSQDEWVTRLQNLVDHIKTAGKGEITAAAQKSYKKGKAALAAMDDFLNTFIQDSTAAQPEDKKQ